MGFAEDFGREMQTMIAHMGPGGQVYYSVVMNGMTFGYYDTMQHARRAAVVMTTQDLEEDDQREGIMERLRQSIATSKRNGVLDWMPAD